MFKGKTGFKDCAWCGKTFEYELWNKKRQYCSGSCSRKANGNNSRTYTFDSFIEKARKIHNNKYDYNEVDFISGSRTMVEIQCPAHGIFTQKASQHLLGKGCRKCADENNRNTNSEFIQKAKCIHGDRYDYSLVVYRGYSKHVQIVCSLHGVFEQTPNQHLGHKAGCPMCTTRVSKGETDWLDSLGVPNNKDHRQVVVGSNSFYFIVDGMSEDGKTIYEYFGDYWHGNPEKYIYNGYNRSCKKFFGELYEETKNRLKLLEELGFNVIYIWESEWLKNTK